MGPLVGGGGSGVSSYMGGISDWGALKLWGEDEQCTRGQYHISVRLWAQMKAAHTINRIQPWFGV